MSELNPVPVVPTPTLTFSIKTLSPTFNGDSSLNAVFNPTVTFLVVLSKEIVFIAIPFTLDVGIIIGSISLILLVFSRIVTLVSPTL